MSTSFTINNDTVIRRDSADIDVGNKHRDHIRAQIGGDCTPKVLNRDAHGKISDVDVAAAVTT